MEAKKAEIVFEKQGS